VGLHAHGEIFVEARRNAYPLVTPVAIGRSIVLALAVLLVGSLAWAAPAPKAAKKSSAPSLSSRLTEQKKLIDAQQAAIEQQKAMIAAQQAAADTQTVLITAQQARLEKLEAQLLEMKKRMEIVESQAKLPAWEDSLERRIRQVEASSQRTPEMPPDVVSAGDFPGSIRIPGSDAAIKFGGLVRTAVVLTLDPLGTDDRFLTNSIPVGAPPVSGEAKRTNISARASRLNTEFRTPAGVEELRAFFEGDFNGAGNAFRLRHAYAQYRGFIAGQTWSTFSDPWVYAEDLDFEGISSENVIRQPQLRYWWSPDSTTRLAVAIETPAVSITGGTGVNLIPDLVARGFWGTTGGAHIQLAGVLRQLRGETSTGVVSSDWGAGGSLTGVTLLRVKQLTDRFMYQLNGGAGVARYINDLNSAGGLDAVFDTTTGVLKALPALGWYLAYEHRWREWEFMHTMNLRSTVLWSRVIVYNLADQPADAYRKTNRLATNLVFSPTGRADLGLEYIFGSRENKDRQKATANQIQLVALFRF
jgi:hypothetical protein